MKYVRIQPRACDPDWADQMIPLLPYLTVHEASKRPIDTGLLDQHGNPLGRVPDTVPMGFQPPAK